MSENPRRLLVRTLEARITALCRELQDSGLSPDEIALRATHQAVTEHADDLGAYPELAASYARNLLVLERQTRGQTPVTTESTRPEL